MIRNATLGLFLATMLTQTAGAQGLVLTEIMYNSQESGDSDVEYLEILNNTEDPIDLTGYYVLDDDDAHGVVPLQGTLAACAVLVVANNNAAFEAKYGVGISLNAADMDSGPWGLGNGGDIARIFRQVGGTPDPAADLLIDSVEFDDAAPWPTEADGDGPALELVDPGSDNNVAASWEITVIDGTPGTYENCGPVSVEGTSWGRVKSQYR